jgi:hypothetical protein
VHAALGVLPTKPTAVQLPQAPAPATALYEIAICSQEAVTGAAKACVCCFVGMSYAAPVVAHTLQRRSPCLVHGPVAASAVCTSYAMSWLITRLTCDSSVGCASCTRSQYVKALPVPAVGPSAGTPWCSPSSLQHVSASPSMASDAFL